jgi:hypothetical protein
VRASGLPYTIVRPGWFDYNGPDEHRLVLLQDASASGYPIHSLKDVLAGEYIVIFDDFRNLWDLRVRFFPVFSGNLSIPVE